MGLGNSELHSTYVPCGQQSLLKFSRCFPWLFYCSVAREPLILFARILACLLRVHFSDMVNLQSSLLEIQTFTQVLHQQGVHAALGYLNSRTPHRYTGIFRFEGQFSRNVVLYDRFDLLVQNGQDVPLAEAFCSLVEREQEPLQVIDASLDPRAWEINTLVISYYGVLIRDPQGNIYGTLCHYDLELCQALAMNLPLLEVAATLFYEHLHLSHSK
jgi:hypothetical protein